MTLYYPPSADSNNPTLVGVAYARGPSGFCLTRAAVAHMAQAGNAEAKKLLAETADISAFPNVSDNAYLCPINPSNRTGAAKYFWENRSDPNLVQTIMQMGSEAGDSESRLDVEFVRLLPGESYMVEFDSKLGADFRESIKLVNAGKQQVKYSECSLIPVAYALGLAGFTVSRTAIEIMASLGSVEARKLLEETENLCRWGNHEPEDKYHYPINVMSHTGAAEYFWKNRSDPFLIQVIRDLGTKAGHPNSQIRVQQIRVLPNETYKVEYACSVGYGYHDDEQIEIKPVA